jgi:CheY-like chemotaxis protein
MSQILLVEDDPWLADCYCQWLRAAGHNLRHVVGVRSALDALDDSLPQLILLDLFLPYANGVQLLYTLRSHADLAEVPVIICSGSLPQEMPQPGLYGVVSMLDKATLNPRALQAAVGEALKHAAI